MTEDCQDGKTTKRHLSDAGLVPLPPSRLHLDHLARLPIADVEVADPTWKVRLLTIFQLVILTSSIVTNCDTITIYSSSPHIKVTSSSTIAALLLLSTRATFVLQRNPNFGSMFSRWDILTGFLCQEWHRVQARQDVLVCKINHGCLWGKFGLFQSLSPRSWAAQAAPAPWEMSLREPPTPFEAQETQEAIIIKPMILARDS